MPKNKKATKKSTKAALKGHKDLKVARYLHVSGLLMMIGSIFMVAMPSLYSAVYHHMILNTPMPHVDEMMNFCIAAGEVIALTYCLIGLFVFRAGEQGTYLAKGMTIFNSIMTVLSILAAILIFLPIPDQTFAYAMQYYNSGNQVASGIIPMAIVAIIDMACIVGILCSVSVLDDMCLVKSKKK